MKILNLLWFVQLLGFIHKNYTNPTKSERLEKMENIVIYLNILQCFETFENIRIFYIIRDPYLGNQCDLYLVIDITECLIQKYVDPCRFYFLHISICFEIIPSDV